MSIKPIPPIKKPGYVMIFVMLEYGKVVIKEWAV